MLARLTLVLISSVLFIAAAMAQSAAQVLAPGYGDLGYDVPPAGSYALPPLGQAADGDVLDDDMPLVLDTHDHELADRCHRVIHLRGGKVDSDKTKLVQEQS